MSKSTDVKQSISDSIYQKLYDRIVRGKLQPGQRITELQIAQDEGVSQAPVREALKRLAEDRLVTLKPRSGCFVCKITTEEAEYLFAIRGRLESLALELAMDRFERDHAVELRTLLKKCQQLTEKQFVRRAVELDERFHAFLCESSGSEDLKILVSKLRARIQMLRIREAKDISRAKESLKWHIRILNAMIDGQAKKALEYLEKHIEETRRNVIDHYIVINERSESVP